MRVELQSEGDLNITLDIMFLRANKKQRRRKNKKELIDTACIIFRDDREIACGIARQNHLDNYNKIVGRKVALAKAIVNIEFLRYIPQMCSINIRRRSMRQHIWNVFHQTFGRWN